MLPGFCLLALLVFFRCSLIIWCSYFPRCSVFFLEVRCFSWRSLFLLFGATYFSWCSLLLLLSVLTVVAGAPSCFLVLLIFCNAFDIFLGTPYFFLGALYFFLVLPCDLWCFLVFVLGAPRCFLNAPSLFFACLSFARCTLFFSRCSLVCLCASYFGCSLVFLAAPSLFLMLPIFPVLSTFWRRSLVFLAHPNFSRGASPMQRAWSGRSLPGA